MLLKINGQQSAIQKGFTLIELLVVIAIIGILATMTVMQIGKAQVKARNVTAQSDISEGAKAVELFKNDGDNNRALVITAGYAVGDTLVDTTGEYRLNINDPANWAFSGQHNIDNFNLGGGDSTYGIGLTATPSAAYTYRYNTIGNGVATGIYPDIPGRGWDISGHYVLSTTLQASVGGFAAYWIHNGTSEFGATIPGCGEGSNDVCTD